MKNNDANIKWRENQKIKLEPEQQPMHENLIRCPICNKECADIFFHLKQKRKNIGHKICLEKVEKYHVRSITEPLINFPRGFKRRKDSSSWRVNYVYTCNRCKIKFCETYYHFKCPICGDEPNIREKGEGEVEYRLSDAQISAIKLNLEAAREKKSEEAEKSKVISIKHIPPMMKKIHRQLLTKGGA